MEISKDLFRSWFLQVYYQEPEFEDAFVKQLYAAFVGGCQTCTQYNDYDEIK